MPTNLLIILLAVIAAIVTYGLYKHKVMWKWIVLYWLVLTAKNVIDVLNS